MFFKNLQEFKNSSGYEINGRWYPRVTSIIGIKAKPALLKYYGDAASFSEALSSTGKSASEGTKIHNTIEAILKGENPDIDLDIKPAINAFFDFLQTHRINLEGGAIEKRVWSTAHRFAGTVDIICELDNQFGILDIKTSSGIWRDYNLQTSAYLGALQEKETWKELPKQPIKNRWILRIDQKQTCLICGATRRTKGERTTVKINNQNNFSKNCDHQWSEICGEWELKLLNNFEKDFEAFLAAKKLWEWENEFWLKQIGY